MCVSLFFRVFVSSSASLGAFLSSSFHLFCSGISSVFPVACAQYSCLAVRIISPNFAFFTLILLKERSPVECLRSGNGFTCLQVVTLYLSELSRCIPWEALANCLSDSLLVLFRGFGSGWNLPYFGVCAKLFIDVTCCQSVRPLFVPVIFRVIYILITSSCVHR